jgi:hypothetical protein
LLNSQGLRWLCFAHSAYDFVIILENDMFPLLLKYSFSYNFTFVLILAAVDLLRKRTISHNMHTSIHYITGRNFGVLDALSLKSS